MPKVWIPKLDLYLSDLHILQSGKWLNDGIIGAAQALLQTQTHRKVCGWQSTQCSKRKQLFKEIPSGAPFIQVLHVSGSHWIVASNIAYDGGRQVDTVCIYDSLPRKSVHHSIAKQICSFFKLPIGCNSIKFDVLNVELQTNHNDCGVFTVACATEIAHGHDPVLCSWNVELMRPHLIKCLEKGTLDRFPTTKRRRVGLGKRIHRTIEINVYCTCRMPNDKSRPMIACDRCLVYYHMDCMSLDPNESYDKEQWVCDHCEETLKLVGK